VLGISTGGKAIADDEIGELLEKINGPAINKNLTGGKAGKQDENCDPKKAKPEKNPNSKVGKTIEYGKDENGNPVMLTVLTREQAQEYYDDMVSKDKLKLKIRSRAHCVARAHQVAVTLSDNGVSSGKYFINGGFVSRITMQSESLKGAFANVKQHVSNFVLVEKENGQLEEMVIDAFLFPGGPVPKSELEKVFKGNRIYRSRAYNLKQSDMNPQGFFQYFKKEIPSREHFVQKERGDTEVELGNAYNVDSPSEISGHNMSVRDYKDFLKKRCQELVDSRCAKFLSEIEKENENYQTCTSQFENCKAPY